MYHVWYNFAIMAMFSKIRRSYHRTRNRIDTMLYHISRKWRNAKKHHWYWRHLKAIIFSLISILFILGGIVAVWISRLPLPDLSAFNAIQVPQSTKIYDRTGKILLYNIHENVQRTVVPLSNISPYIQNASVAIEDSDFYTNIGIQAASIIRSALVDLFTGSYDQGGSTITQQVIKNSLLTQSKTISRKIEEWVLAIKLTRAMPKAEILATYLNETGYGGNMYGVEEASKAYFGTDASAVDLAQAAYLAALPQAPSYYSPYGQNKAALTARQKLVLQRMLDNKFITQDQYTQAIAENVQFLPQNTGTLLAPHFSMYVRNYLEQKYGDTAVDNGGLKVTTTLDYNLQQKMEQIVANFAPQIKKQFDATNMAMVAIDPTTGDILAMVGSENYYDTANDGNFNAATTYRQPGSTFKPFVYSTLFEKGYTPETILFDVKTQFSTQCTVDGKPKDPTASSSVCYEPDEYDKIYDGPVTIRYALAQSRNIPAVKALYLAGIPDSIQTAQNMGITSLTNPQNYGLSLVLGGGEVSLLQMTSAYGVFANDGIRNPYRAVLEVDDSNGNILEQTTTSPIQVMPIQPVREINSILSDPSHGIRMSSISAITDPMGRPVAIKTGTTNNYKDVWAIGYTPNLVVGAWAGNNDDTPMDQNIASLVITPVWGAFMTEALPSFPVENFKAPDPSPTNLKPVMRGIWQGGTSYMIDSISGKLATQYTPPSMVKEVVQDNVDSILQWVDKNNPLGPIPTNPANDPQYPYWEYGVRQWFENVYLPAHPDFKEFGTSTILNALNGPLITSGLASGTPLLPDMPTQYDDVHVPANFPQVTITYPASDTAVSADQKVVVNFTETGKFPIEKSDLYINGQYMSENDSNLTQFTFVPSDVQGINMDATNTITVSVYDNVLNEGTAEAEFVVQ
jgi:penicillin-binding protein 1C